jgi:hypothetical protein
VLTPEPHTCDGTLPVFSIAGFATPRQPIFQYQTMPFLDENGFSSSLPDRSKIK